MDQAWDRPTVVRVTGGETEGEQLATVIDDQMELEAVEPPHRGLAAAGVDPEDAVLLDARGMANTKEVESIKLIPVHVPGWCAGRSPGARGSAASVRQSGCSSGAGKLLAMDLHILGVEALEGPIARLLKEDEDREDLRGMQPSRSSPTVLPAGGSSRSHSGSKRCQKASTEQYRSSILIVIALDQG